MDKRLQEIFARYEHNQATEQERKLIEDWFASFDDEQAVSLLSDRSEKQRLRNELFSRVMKATRPARVIQWPHRIGMAAAVIFVFLMSGLGFYLLRTHDQPMLSAVTGAGSVKKIVLADGTEVWLNAAGRLRYPEKFDGRIRDIYLDEGEAFFNVKHKTAQPFIVHSGHFETQVLGTSFNVQCYKLLNSLHVLVRSGKVSVSRNGHLLHQLINDQELVSDNKGGTFNLINRTATDADSWTQGVVELQNATFTELALKMQNTYNIHLSMQNKAMLNGRYTLQLNVKDGLEKNLEIICKIHHLNYRRAQREIIIY